VFDVVGKLQCIPNVNPAIFKVATMEAKAHGKLDLQWPNPASSAE
jgi:hypothetical protein